MTKEAELSILRDTIARLGRNSYLGPWLEDQLPWIESDIRSDIPPMSSYSQSRAVRAEELEDNRRRISEMESQAQLRIREHEERLSRTFNSASSYLHRIAAELSR
jgi:hypothetical protein